MKAVEYTLMRGNERVLKAYKVDDGYSLLFFSESQVRVFSGGGRGVPAPFIYLTYYTLFLEGFLLSEP